jgi:hypothetical protein
LCHRGFVDLARELVQDSADFRCLIEQRLPNDGNCDIGREKALIVFDTTGFSAGIRPSVEMLVTLSTSPCATAWYISPVFGSFSNYS